MVSAANEHGCWLNGRQKGGTAWCEKEKNNSSRGGQEVQVTVMDANEQTRRTQAAITPGAYEIFESRGSASWNELEDWRKAESELVRPLSCGRIKLGDTPCGTGRHQQEGGSGIKLAHAFGVVSRRSRPVTMSPSKLS